MTDVEKFRKHVKDLEIKHNLTVRLDPTMERHGAFSGRAPIPWSVAFDMGVPSHKHLVSAHPIDDETSYAIVLHEIGHMVDPKGCDDARNNFGAPRDLDLDGQIALLRIHIGEETAAWNWAQKNALHWSAGMESAKFWSFKSYTDALERRLRIQALPRHERLAEIERMLAEGLIAA